MSRDPLSYIFCIAFPILMLVIMTIVNSSIPAESGMTLFRLDNLSGGIAVFGQTFVMLFTAISVTKDRSGSFLTRLFASPMKSSDFTGGYILPMVFVAIVQAVVAFIASIMISLIGGFELKIPGLLAAVAAMIPSAVMFTAIGLIFGTVFNEKSAPPLCSIIITLSSIIGGIWFDVEGVGGFMAKVSRFLPFIYSTKVARAAIKTDFTADGFLIPLLIVTCFAALLTLLAAVVFKRKMRADLS